MKELPNIKELSNYIIIIGLIFFFRFLPPFGSLTEVGMQILGVFAGVIYGWISVGIGWPSVLVLQL